MQELGASRRRSFDLRMITEAANKAARQAENRHRAAKAGGTSSNVAPSRGGTQKALPSNGGMPAGNIALLGAGALLVSARHCSTRRAPFRRET
jgi:hypothetical protein